MSPAFVATLGAFRVRVTKGCRAINVRKGETSTFKFTEHAGVGVEAGRVRGSATLWLAGNRVHAPTVKAGDRMSLNTGRPEYRVVVEVLP